MIPNLIGRRAQPHLALGELEAGASAGLAGLLALFGAGIALDVTGLLQRRTKLRVHLLEGTRNAVSDRTGLAGDTTASDVDRHVDLLAKVNREERGISLLGEILVGEVAVKGATITVSLPVPSVRRTRAVEVLRRPVPRKIVAGAVVVMF